MPYKKTLVLLVFTLLLSFVSYEIKAQSGSSSPIIAKPSTLSRDSTARDSTAKKKNAIDAPVKYTSRDSMVMVMDSIGNFVYQYGEASVEQKNMKLTGEYIEIDAVNNTVYASYALDSVGEEFGYPVFSQGETPLEMKKMRYNFKTGKGIINDVITEQGEGYVTASLAKKMNNGDICALNAKYTTCDEHDHPHFYFNLTKSKMTPNKRIVTAPAYLVLEDVPLPIVIPFGFFPVTKDYSSGVIMPTYGDELTRGFSLRDGGYYFAINDYLNLALTGEIYTKGSWGVNARSGYKKRYKFSGGFDAGYLVTVQGDKGSADYSKSNDLKINWTHSQDSKANPFQTLSASVNFSTSSFDRNSLNSLYNNNYTQNTKSSSINYTRRFPGKPLTISGNVTVNQQSKDSIINLTLPNLTITLSDIYPFRRKEQIGEARWYEAIRFNYTGLFMNSVSAKEYNLLKTNLVKDWKNGMKHDIPVSASFNLLKYINISPSFNYSSRWYTKAVYQEYNRFEDRFTPSDTVLGFNRIYDYGASVGMNTKLYGYFKPLKIFGGNRIEMIRHVMTPSVSLSASPDFGSSKFGYYTNLEYFNQSLGRLDTLRYSPFANGMWGVPGEGSSGTMSFTLDNNLEMKWKDGQDSIRKISLIDHLGLGISHNFLADSMKWSDMNLSLRLKLNKSFTLNLQGLFDTYTYNAEGVRVDIPRWEAGKGIGRLRATGTSFSYSLNNDVIRKWLGKGEKDEKENPSNESSKENESVSSEDKNEEEEQHQGSLRTKKKNDGEYDADGYLLTNIPWNLNFNYSMNLGYDLSRGRDGKPANFNPVSREYGYKLTHTLGLSGSITPAKGWSFNFTTSYDFDYKKFATMVCNITRNMHCWQMSASVIPIGPYQSYSFSIAVSSSLLKDLKYNQSSNYRDAVDWGY